MTEHVLISVDDAEEYTQSLGQVVGGAWRQIAWASRMGIPEALGLSTQDWVEQRLGGYVRLSVSERREAVRELTAQPEQGGQGLTQREASDVLGVSPGTVNADLKPEPVQNRTAGPVDLQEEPEPVQNRTAGPVPVTVPLPSEDDPPEQEPGRTTRELLAQSDQNDWRTPRKFLEAARGVLGAIDLDPASSAEANQTVQAARFFTEEDDGLTQPWKGRIWLNPPYGGQARLFIERLIKEYEVGNVTAAMTLVNSHPTETAWFQQLFRYTVCFVRGRIDFGGPSRAVASTSTHGSAIVCLGGDLEAFRREFSKFGAVVHAL